MLDSFQDIYLGVALPGRQQAPGAAGVPLCKSRCICLDILLNRSGTRQHVWLDSLLCWTVYKHQKYVMILICRRGTAGMSTRDSCSIEPFVKGHGCVGL